MKLNSQQLKDIFNDKSNDKKYEVVVYTAFNFYPIINVIKDDENGRIVILTEEIGQYLGDSGD